MWSSMVGAGIHLPPNPMVTIWSLTVMMKHDHISKTEIVGDQQADSTQGPMHCPYCIRKYYVSWTGNNISRVIL